MKKGILTGIGAVIGLLVTVAAWYALGNHYTYKGVLIDPPARAADFELINQDNQPFRLSQQHGKVVLLFFGYTNCPDVCPITLAQFKEIKDQLGEKASQVQFVMITVDPQRDTTEQLQAYLGKFDPEFVGLTGEPAVLKNVWKDYGVYQEAQDVQGSLDYLVDHTARIYTIDPAGNWRLNYPFGMETGQIVQDLLHLLQDS
jgi:protein SCO1